MTPIDLSDFHERLRRVDPYTTHGRVAQVIGLVIEADGPEAQIGELCYVHHSRHDEPVAAEVVGFREGRTLLMPLGEMRGIAPGNDVVATGHPIRIGVGEELLGRVVNGLGMPLDGEPIAQVSEVRSLDSSPPAPMQRKRITQQMEFGVRALDAFTPCGYGQRLGIFAGSGVGKSSLMGMIARSSSADVNVIALVGERGREVREFVERELGSEGLKKSVVVVASSNEPAVMRVTAAFAATTIAEYFRDQGKNVLLMMDSVTRCAMAQREIGLAIGEPPATRGYTPSVFALLPQLLERSGTSDVGTITALYNVLVEGDDMNEPISDTVRGILDGHVVLSRDLAHMNHYPAIDILSSVSRLTPELLSPSQLQAAAVLREVLATYKSREDLIAIGAYAVGTDPHVDYSIAKKPDVEIFLRQAIDENTPLDQTMAVLEHLAADALPQY